MIYIYQLIIQVGAQYADVYKGGALSGILTLYSVMNPRIRGVSSNIQAILVVSDIFDTFGTP